MFSPAKLAFVFNIAFVVAFIAWALLYFGSKGFEVPK